jgi:hypothetical protein
MAENETNTRRTKNKKENGVVLAIYYINHQVQTLHLPAVVILQLRCGGTRAEKFCVSVKRTSPCDLAAATFRSTTGSRGVRDVW